jgi:hypothetical protein
MTQEDAATTILSLITDVLQEHSEILVNHQKHLVRLSSEVAAIKNSMKYLKAANSLNSSDPEFLTAVSGRLKAISSTLDNKL